MILNNGIHFLFWTLFFDRFKEMHGWTLHDMILLFTVVGTSLGLIMILFGKRIRSTKIVAEGDLNRYLSLPHPVLLHVLVTQLGSLAGRLRLRPCLVRARRQFLSGRY